MVSPCRPGHSDATDPGGECFSAVVQRPLRHAGARIDVGWTTPGRGPQLWLELVVLVVARWHRGGHSRTDAPSLAGPAVSSKPRRSPSGGVTAQPVTGLTLSLIVSDAPSRRSGRAVAVAQAPLHASAAAITVDVRRPSSSQHGVGRVRCAAARGRSFTLAVRVPIVRGGRGRLGVQIERDLCAHRGVLTSLAFCAAMHSTHEVCKSTRRSTVVNGSHTVVHTAAVERSLAAGPG